MYDAIVVGAGTNGLALGLSLARAGLRTLITEQREQVGGQAVTEEPLLPGFLVHPHANFLSYQDFPAVGEMLSCQTVTPVAQHGLCFRDGRPPLIIHRRDAPRRTRRSLSRYSAADASTYTRCKRIADRLTPALAALYGSAPHAAAFTRYLTRLARAYRDIIDTDGLGQSSARSVIDRLFHTDEIRTLFYLLASEFSGNIEEPGGDVSLLGYVFWLLGRRRLPIGGMGTVPETMAHTARNAGAHIRLNTEVLQVVVEDGAVQGVLLADGERVPAPMVATSSADRAAMTATESSRLDQTSPDVIGSYAACLTEAPHYTSSDHDSDINHCAQTFIGLDTTGEVLQHLAELRSGQLPAPCGVVRVNTLWDPGQAPEGGHVAGADCVFPDGLDPTYLSGIEHGYPAAFADMWRQYAPNIEPSLLAHRISIAPDVNRTLVLREGQAQYRGPAKGWYTCGSTTHPGGGIHGACGTNAAHVILADLRKTTT
ncbi:phytoene desaturase family protein [Sciscionella sediminilitoris]|uniref:phytoene desaturase family protein n=1 Tax=Sciscionella sediminilitoris TaxID=1445613 RepID=UPI0004DED7EA|nr:NAD(P)/FAD-dependent oxidoreductase [Sciscionella sp. SE31]